MTDAEQARERLALRKAAQAVILIQRRVAFDGVAINGRLPFSNSVTQTMMRSDQLMEKSNVLPDDLCIPFLAGEVIIETPEPSGGWKVAIDEMFGDGFAAHVDVSECLDVATALVGSLEEVIKKVQEVLLQPLSEDGLSYGKVKEIYDRGGVEN